ncbi:hypothetical protein HY409_00260 [Candidatus Gottesmanbacteria bacterium]|nr:hypothetical protein [Candidatus Gottesmanbacteria bacterium]
MSTDVNLLQTKTPQLAQAQTIESQLRIVNYVLAVTVIVFSILIGSVYIYIKNSAQHVINIKKQNITAIANLSTKEVLLLALKDRLRHATQIRQSQYSFDKIFAIIERLDVTRSISSIVILDNGTIQTSIRLGSIEETFYLMNNMTKEVTSGIMKQLIIDSMSLDEVGRLQMAISFRVNP